MALAPAVRLDARRYLGALRRWWWLPITGLVPAVVISYFIVRQLPSVYEAQTTLLVNFTSPQTGVTYDNALLSQQLVKTYTQMAVQPIVLEQVAPDLGLDIPVEALARLVSADALRDTQLFAIKAKASDPAVARDIANDIARVFIAQQQRRLSQNEASNPISVIQPALLPVNPVEPRPAIYVTLTALLALLVMLGSIYVLAFLDDTINTAADAERASSLPTLGLIPDMPAESRQSIEAYRLLRTALSFAAARQPLQTLLITSPAAGDGKSTIAASLARSLAQAGERVTIVDADTRRPYLHHLYGLNNDLGLGSRLMHGARTYGWPRAYLQDGPVPNLSVLTSGPLCHDTELLQSQFAVILDDLKRLGPGIIVVDSPPLLAADALLLAQKMDAALLVVRANATRPMALRQASGALGQSGTHILGTVLNRTHGGSEAYLRAYGGGETTSGHMHAG